MFVVCHVGTARLDMLVSTRSTHWTCQVVSRRDEPSGIWAYAETQGHHSADRKKSPNFSWLFVTKLQAMSNKCTLI